MQVRDFEDSDMDGVMYCSEQFHQESGYSDLADFDRESAEQFIRMLSANPAGILLVVEDMGRIVGLAAAIIGTVMFNRNVLFSQEMFWWIDPGWRDAGAGSELLNELENRGQELGASILMMVGLDGLESDKVHGMYVHRGYRPGEMTYIKGV